MNYKTFIPDSWTAFVTKWREWFPKVKKTFVGTRADWDALTTAEQVQYDLADFTDDPAGGELIVVDEVTDGNMNPVTSNAVFDAIASKLNVIKGSVSSAVGVTVTLAVPSSNFFLLVGGWNTSGYSYRALYFISLEPRSFTVIAKAISKGLGEVAFDGTIAGTYANGTVTLSITSSSSENIGSIVSAFYASRS